MITPAIDVTGLKLVSGIFNIYPKFIGASGSGISQLTYQRSFLPSGNNYVTYVTVTKNPYREVSPVLDAYGYASGSGNYSFRVISKGDNINYIGFTTGAAFTGRF